ncbi:hypothetical protein PC129_g379 [Phytophthora cactorum]|uniref:Uncharacterized protein n=1 Tax=Phytophthora cactorum TaxID=29920 RepID=A0A329T110_9STRA|nr:hypothetical protein Pcac1_g3834 [Phytophthora cactorum]KAG2832823.1 hypothetical protein PC112_g6736 [Phytophthora cactorum]KAG2835298.1 hypothetical protein PC111_g5482 [Phytophthora cactorum]KAG2862931.1 hypothetical protein PC113_g5872 [Phytophthora cactorum]KAG2918332.1 hypothetical protein PC114_g6863 [Phytophthora cactorum]
MPVIDTDFSETEQEFSGFATPQSNHGYPIEMYLIRKVDALDKVT